MVPTLVPILHASCVDPVAVCNDTTSTDLGWPVIAISILVVVILVVGIVMRSRRRQRRNPDRGD